MQRWSWICFLIWTLAGAWNATAQEGRLLVRAQAKSPSEFLSELSLQSGYNIIYSDDVVSGIGVINLELKGVTVYEVLDAVLRQKGIEYAVTGEEIVLFKSTPLPARYTVSGVITDSVSGEPLISAVVFERISGLSTTTNNYGYYSLTIPSGNIELQAVYLNYRTKTSEVYLRTDENIPIRLHPDGILPPVIVNAHQQKEKERVVVAPAERITLADLQSNIHLGGTSDLYRYADFIPGVHTGTDGVGGIHVRGGANDQNLILMDGVPVYHPNHLLGLVSVFNFQVLQQASIYKANFPSRFSGRLSSVMDVRTREGNIHHWGMSGNIGVAELGLLVEGPLVTDKVGLLLSGRYFLPGLFIPDLTRNYKERNGVKGQADLDYADFNGKINWKISDKDRLYLSMYQGTDQFSDFTINERDQIDPESGVRVVTYETYDKNLNWTNQTGVLRWNHILTDKIFANVIASTSVFELQSVDRSEFRFAFPGSGMEPQRGFDTKEFKSGIQDQSLRIELDIRPSPDHQITAGGYSNFYQFKPKSVTINEESQVGEFFLDEGLVDDIYFATFQVRALEAGIYAEDNWIINPRWKLTSGIHISNFFVQGTHYLDPQLRLSADYTPSTRWAFNMGYSRMTQYLHNITSSSIGLPTDLWVPTTAKVSPALSDQYSVGAIWKASDRLAIDISGYLKNMRNLISYQEGASFLLREGLVPSSIVDAANWESKITQGTGEASGVELQLTYDYRQLQFRCNGTWSKSYRMFEGINQDKPFPDRYDRRWSSTFTGQMKLGPRWSCGVNWIFGTGIAITLAESKFFNPGSFFPEVGITYGSRNGHRLPAYHRLDVSLNYQLAKKEKFSHSLTLNFYNVYNRTNPLYLTLVEDPITGKFEVRQISLFNFLPSISYRFNLQ